MTDEKIKRINYLAKKSRESGLTEEEKDEQIRLRDEYRKAVIGNLTAELNNTYIERPDGTKQRVHRVK